MAPTTAVRLGRALTVLVLLILPIGCVHDGTHRPVPPLAHGAPQRLADAGSATRPFVCSAVAEAVRAIDVAPDPSAKQARVEALIARVSASGTPLIEPGMTPDVGCVTFLYRRAAHEVTLAGDMNGWDMTADRFTQIASTDLSLISQEFPLDARLDDKLILDGDWILDPLNPQTMLAGYGPNSQFAMPRYVPPPQGRALRRHSARHGRDADVEFPAAQRVASDDGLSPPGYAARSDRYPVVYFHDGQDELDFAKLDNVLEYLLDKRATPAIIAVMVPPVDRGAEYCMNPAFEDFVDDEAVARIDGAYRTRPLPRFRAAGGIFHGGIAAISLALHRPEVFGNCIAQSSGGPEGEIAALRALIRESPRRDVAFYLDAGTFEKTLHRTDLLSYSRQLRDELTARGYRLRYQEVPEGHSWGDWRARRDDALVFFWGGATNGGADPGVADEPSQPAGSSATRRQQITAPRTSS